MRDRLGVEILVSKDIPDLAGKSAEGVTAAYDVGPGVDSPESIRFVKAFRKSIIAPPRYSPASPDYEAVNYRSGRVRLPAPTRIRQKSRRAYSPLTGSVPRGRKGGIDPQTGRPKESAFVKVVIKDGALGR